MTINFQGRADEAARRRRVFMLVHLAKACVGAALGVVFFGLIGRPDTAEWIAIAGLASPALLALLALSPLPLAWLERLLARAEPLDPDNPQPDLGPWLELPLPVSLRCTGPTLAPADWQQLRWQWEVSHALNALIAFGGFCSLAISMLVKEK